MRRQLVTVLLSGTLVLALAGFVLIQIDRDKEETVVASAAADQGSWEQLASDPLSPRQFPLFAWSGRELLVFGGDRLQSGPIAAPASDGALYDPAADAWRIIAEAPFESALTNLSGLFMDTEFLIVGAPCQASPDPVESACSFDRLEAATYDPLTGSWVQRSAPASAASSGPGSSRAEAIGWTGSLAIFDIGGSIQAFDPDVKQWRQLAQPPVSAQRYCAGDGVVVALELLDQVSAQTTPVAVDPGEEVVVPVPDVEPVLVASTLDVASLEWSEAQPASLGPVAPVALSVLCAGDGVATVPVGAFDVPRPELGLQYYNRENRWDSLAPPPVDVGAAPRSTWSGREVFVFGDGGTMALDPTSGEWRLLNDRSWFEQDLVDVLWAGDRAVLYVRHADTGDLSLGTFTP